MHLDQNPPAVKQAVPHSGAAPVIQTQPLPWHHWQKNSAGEGTGMLGTEDPGWYLVAGMELLMFPVALSIGDSCPVGFVERVGAALQQVEVHQCMDRSSQIVPDHWPAGTSNQMRWGEVGLSPLPWWCLALLCGNSRSRSIGSIMNRSNSCMLSRWWLEIWRCGGGRSLLMSRETRETASSKAS